MTFYPSDTQQSLLYQLNKVVYLSAEWWKIKEKYALKKVNAPELFPVNDSRRASLRETQARQAEIRQGQL